MANVDLGDDPELPFFQAIDEAIKAAEGVLALAGAPEEDEDPDAFWAAYEAVHHCETCMVRNVMETVWPAIEAYIDWLRAQIPSLPVAER